MKWDIDKATRAFETSSAPGTGYFRVLTDLTVMVQAGINPTPEERQRGAGLCWCVMVGGMHQPKVFSYDRSIRTAYLKARRKIKAMSKQELVQFGLQVPKRSAGFAKARKLRKAAGKATK
jgi:hypothetical protein